MEPVAPVTINTIGGDPQWELVMDGLLAPPTTQEGWKQLIGRAQLFAPNRAAKVAAMAALFAALDEEGIPHSRYYILAGMIRSAAWRFLSPIAWIGIGKKDRVGPLLDAAGDLWALLLVWEAEVAAGVRGYSDEDAEEFLDGGVIDTNLPESRGCEPGTPVPLFPDIWVEVLGGRKAWEEDVRRKNIAARAAVWGDFFAQK